MHSTKTEILARLKRSDGASVDELSSALGLASMTVRQHLAVLERDALVRAEEVRRPTGRPHYLYRLTEGGHRRVADGYDRFVALLVEEAGFRPENGATEPEALRRALFRRAATSLAERHRAEVLMLAGRGRVERTVEILRVYAGFADWHECTDGYELRDFSCVFRSTVSRDGPCEWHETFLERLLDAPVRPVAPADGCADCCSYVISSRANAPAGNRGNT
jgi:predicted ArsR family transcriptional regulator